MSRVMSKRAAISKLRRYQLDRKLVRKSFDSLAVPEKGYIREIRNALGMSAIQLAGRLGITQSAVAQLEKSEELGSITLNSLRKAAEAMRCTLVYGLVPNRSLEEIVRERAQLAASRIVEQVRHTMSLEGQAPDREELKMQVDELASDLAQQLNRVIWEVDE